MTTLAHDQFDAVMGTRRGGGASHTLLGEVFDDHSAYVALGGLRIDPAYATTADGQATVDALISFLHVRNDPLLATLALKLLPDVGVQRRDAHRFFGFTAGDYVRAVIDSKRPISTTPTEDSRTHFRGELADKLYSRGMTLPDESLLGALVSEEGQAELLVAAGDARYREVHGFGEDLMGEAAWKLVFAEAFHSLNDEAARSHIKNAALKAIGS